MNRASYVPGNLAHCRWAVRLGVLCVFLAPTPLPSQEVRPQEIEEQLPVESEMEDYLRILQTVGVAGYQPWSIRGFSTREIVTRLPDDPSHPWSGRYAFSANDTGAFGADWLPVSASTVYNSAFPFGGGDGPVWAGRGLTTVVRAGGSVRYGPISLTVEPVAFWAQNADFEMAPNRLGSEGIYRDPLEPEWIDLPQRFGEHDYARLDPGESTLRVDLPVVTFGASTASQHWGPTMENPLLLGNNAGGFPHVFVGTSEPLNLWIARAHARVVWGRLDQSDYSPVTGPAGRRFASGLIGVLVPRGLGGLEVGVARFFHTTWTDGKVHGDLLLRPLEDFFKAGIADSDLRKENQLATAFVRWVFPRSGLELFGEFLREDHSWDARQFILEPEDISGYTIGLRKVWVREDDRFVALRGEILNSETSHRERDTRGPVAYPLYIHYRVHQGHTLRGQLLGSAAGYGGAGSVLALDMYHGAGRWSAEWKRTLYRDRTLGVAPPDAPAVDVAHSLGVEGLLFRGDLDLFGEVTAVYALNRHLREDVFNLHASLGVRFLR